MTRLENKFYELIAFCILEGLLIAYIPILMNGELIGYLNTETNYTIAYTLQAVSCFFIVGIIIQISRIFQYYKIEKKSLSMVQKIDKQAEQLRELEILRRHIAEQDQLVNLVMMSNKPNKIPLVMSRLKNDIEKRYLKMEEENLKQGLIFLLLSNFRSQALTDRIDFSIKIYASLENILLPEEQLAIVLKETLERAFSAALNLDEQKRQIKLSVGEKLTECIFEISIPAAESFAIPDAVKEQIILGNGKVLSEGSSFKFSIGKKGVNGKQLLKLISGGFIADAK